MRRPVHSLFVLLSLPLATGCFSRGAVWADRVEPGAPLVDPGPDAYRVWHDAAGWHLRVRSDVIRRFEGEISGGDTRHVQLVAIPANAVGTYGGGLRFSFLAAEEAGFDWRGDGCVSLALFIDGDARPTRVAIGAFGASPSRIPQTVCPFLVW
jgi:hypothetical protein